jgi:hypothetical protein
VVRTGSAPNRLSRHGPGAASCAARCPTCAIDPVTRQVIRSSKTTAARYEHERPDQLVHMDVKKIGRIPDRGGRKAHGRAAVSTSRHQLTRVRFDYVPRPGRRPLPWRASIVTDADTLPAEYFDTIRRRGAERLAHRDAPAAVVTRS